MHEISLQTEPINIKKIKECDLYTDSDLIDINYSLNKWILSEWSTKKTFNGNIQWWESSGTTGRPQKIAFRPNFHQYFIELSYKEYFNIWIKDLTYVHLAMPRIKPRSASLSDSLDKRKLDVNEYILSPQKMCNFWMEEDMVRIYKELHLLKPQIMRADPFYLGRFLLWIKNNNKKLPKINRVLCSYSLLTDKLSKEIIEALDCELYELYGLSEIGPVWIKDIKSKKIHILPNLVVHFKRLEGEEKLYKVLISSSRNELYYLWRYDTGDIVQIDKGEIRLIGRDNYPYRLNEDLLILDVINSFEEKYEDIYASQFISHENKLLFNIVTCSSQFNILKKNIEEAEHNLLTINNISICNQKWLQPETSGKFVLLKKSIKNETIYFNQYGKGVNRRINRY